MILKPFLILTLISIVLLWYLHFSKKATFKRLKKHFGNSEKGGFDLISLNDLLIKYNEKAKYPLCISDFTVLKVGDRYLTVLYGGAGFEGIGSGGEHYNTKSVVFTISTEIEGKKYLLKNERIFSFAEEHDGVSVFWISNIKKLESLLSL
jgi:hypothetical protein